MRYDDGEQFTLDRDHGISDINDWVESRGGLDYVGR